MSMCYPAAMEFIHHLDAETKKLKIKKLTERDDAAPRSANPIRRFREELRLTRRAFADLVQAPIETLRNWEALTDCVQPEDSTMRQLIAIARRNEYPLYYTEVIEFVENAKIEVTPELF